MSDWKAFIELRQIDNDISDWGYSKDFIDNQMDLKDNDLIGINMCTGRTCFSEPLEVKEENGTILWRVNKEHYNRKIPKHFDTQYGRFVNHYNGEFISWLDLKINKTGEPVDSSIIGRFIDIFDCGEYCIGISSLKHTFDFSVHKIDKKLDVISVYDNLSEEKRFRLEYMGRIKYDQGHMLFASGFEMPTRENSKSVDVTRAFYVGTDGNCSILKEWPFQIAHSNSIAALGEVVYFGQNKMITSLNIKSGIKEYYTNKGLKEIGDLRETWED